MMGKEGRDLHKIGRGHWNISPNHMKLRLTYRSRGSIPGRGNSVKALGRVERSVSEKQQEGWGSWGLVKDQGRLESCAE